MLFWRQGCLLPNGAVTGSKWVGVKQQKSGKYSKLEELHEA